MAAAPLTKMWWVRSAGVQTPEGKCSGSRGHRSRCAFCAPSCYLMGRLPQEKGPHRVRARVSSAEQSLREMQQHSRAALTCVEDLDLAVSRILCVLRVAIIIDDGDSPSWSVTPPLLLNARGDPPLKTSARVSTGCCVFAGNMSVAPGKSCRRRILQRPVVPWQESLQSAR